MDRSFHPRGSCGYQNQIKINDLIGQNFQILKGLRQGDPLSPIFFNIIIDIFDILINKAKYEGQVTGIVPHVIDGGLSILQYADNTILFMDHDIEKATNMKMLLCDFEQLSGPKINYHKSEIFCFGQAKELEQQYS